MPITPQSILPTRPLPTVATGPIVSTGVGSVSVRIRPQAILPRDASTQIATGTVISANGTAASVQLDGDQRHGRS